MHSVSHLPCRHDNILMSFFVNSQFMTSVQKEEKKTNEENLAIFLQTSLDNFFSNFICSLLNITISLD